MLKLATVKTLALPMVCSVSFCPMHTFSKSAALFVGTIFILLATSACDHQKPKPAALAEHAVLEQLAEAYNSVGERYPMQPQAMPPKGRKEFLDQVFSQAGYSYSASLSALAQSDVEKTNPNQRDLAELLLLPARGLLDADLSPLFTADELSAVRKLRANYP